MVTHGEGARAASRSIAAFEMRVLQVIFGCAVSKFKRQSAFEGVPYPGAPQPRYGRFAVVLAETVHVDEPRGFVFVGPRRRQRQPPKVGPGVHAPVGARHDGPVDPKHARPRGLEPSRLGPCGTGLGLERGLVHGYAVVGAALAPVGVPRIAPRLEAHFVIHRSLVHEIVRAEHAEIESEPAARESGDKIRVRLHRGVIEVRPVRAFVYVVTPAVAPEEIQAARNLRFIEKARPGAEGFPRVQPLRFRREIFVRRSGNSGQDSQQCVRNRYKEEAQTRHDSGNKRSDFPASRKSRQTGHPDGKA